MNMLSSRPLLLAAATLVAASSAHAVDSNWTGATSADWNIAGNWSPGNIPGNPSTNRAVFQGTGSQDNVTFASAVNTGFGGILVKAAQSSPLSINSTGTAGLVFRLAANTGITIESGAGAFSMGTTNNAFQLVLQGVSTTHTFQNDSANMATLGDKISLLHGGSQSTNTSFTGSGNWDVKAAIAGGSLAITKSGTGTTTLAGTNTYLGTTTVNAGTLQFAKAVSFYNSTSNAVSGTNAAKLTVNTGGTAAFNVGGATEFTAADITTLLGASNGTVGFKTGAAIGIDTTNAVGAFNFATNLANPTGSTSLGLTKLGTGTLTLSGANSYTGVTTVKAGTLNTASNTALGNGAVSVAGGTLAINDASVGQVTLGTGANLAMTSGKIAIDITGAATFDTIVGTGTGQFLLTGGTLELTGFSGFESGSYNLFSGFAGTGNDATGLNITGYDTTNWLASLGTNGVLSFSAVPEPSTYGLIGAGALAAVAFVRRRRKHAGAVA